MALLHRSAGNAFHSVSLSSKLHFQRCFKPWAAWHFTRLEQVKMQPLYLHAFETHFHVCNSPAQIYKYISLKQANVLGAAALLLCTHFLDLHYSFQSITYSSRVIARSLWHLWNDSTVKESKLHSLTQPQGPHRKESKCGSELWKQWTEFKNPMHVFLWSVSGSGSRSNIKGEGGKCFREKENDETAAPPHPTLSRKNATYGTWCGVGGQGRGVFEFQV